MLLRPSRSRLVHLYVVQQLVLVLRQWGPVLLLAHLDKLRQYVVTFSTVSSELVVGIPLENVGTSVDQIPHDL